MYVHVCVCVCVCVSRIAPLALPEIPPLAALPWAFSFPPPPGCWGRTVVRLGIQPPVPSASSEAGGHVDTLPERRLPGPRRRPSVGLGWAESIMGYMRPPSVPLSYPPAARAAVRPSEVPPKSLRTTSLRVALTG